MTGASEAVASTVADVDLLMLLRRRARDLGTTISAVAADAGLARSYLYKLAAGETLDPSVRTLARLAAALQVSPIALFRRYVDFGPRDSEHSGGSARTDSSMDAAVFNADVTIPDHSVVKGGEAFRKVWEVQNVGQIPWRGRRLIRADEQFVIAKAQTDGSLVSVQQPHLVCLHDQFSIPYTPPGACARLEVDFVAPRENGSMMSIWRICDEAGEPCYCPSFLLQVIVTVIEK